MEGESGFEILTGALVYPFTNGRRLFAGGLVGLLYFIFIGIPFLLGYQVRCGRNILEGNDDLPGWEDIDKIFLDGILAIIIVLLYGIVTAIIVYGLFFVLLFAGILEFEGTALLLFLIFTFIVDMIVAIPLGILSQISLMNFIYTEELGTGLNPLNSLRLLLSRPFEFLKAIIVEIVAIIILYVPYFVVFVAAAFVGQNCGGCLIMLIAFLSIGWMVFIQNSVHIYIWTKFFARVVGDNPDYSFDTSLVA
jgi:hypothetical protein